MKECELLCLGWLTSCGKEWSQWASQWMTSANYTEITEAQSSQWNVTYSIFTWHTVQASTCTPVVGITNGENLACLTVHACYLYGHLSWSRNAGGRSCTSLPITWFENMHGHISKSLYGSLTVCSTLSFLALTSLTRDHPPGQIYFIPTTCTCTKW